MILFIVLLREGCGIGGFVGVVVGGDVHHGCGHGESVVFGNGWFDGV